MGGAGTLCKQAPASVAELPLTCKSGEFKTSEATFGIIPNFAKKSNQCMNDAITNTCTNTIDTAGIQTFLNSNCNGQRNCSFNELTKYLNQSADNGNCSIENAQFFI
jgi:hypothetical protein